jgi:hypothetical protein
MLFVAISFAVTVEATIVTWLARMWERVVIKELARLVNLFSRWVAERSCVVRQLQVFVLI